MNIDEDLKDFLREYGLFLILYICFFVIGILIIVGLAVLIDGCK